jgi:hypothetical protein
MKLTATLREKFKITISYLFILLFVYAAVSKLMDFQNFQVQLGQSPLLSSYAEYVSFGVIGSELLISIILGIPQYRTYALYLAIALMSMFTSYIIIILNFSAYVPCSCGGILEKLGWTEHLLFNIFFIVSGCVAILLNNHIKKAVPALTATIALSSFLIIILFINSESTIQKENPFIRRFTPNIISRLQALELNNYGFYIAGQSKNKVYLGNTFSPLTVLEIDNRSNQKKQFTISLDNDKFKFRSVKIKVLDTVFFLYDGYVPIIYRGAVSNWEAKTWVTRKPYFTMLQPVANNKCIFMGQQLSNGESFLGTIEKGNKYKINRAEKILQKQMDGIFDTDGMMAYNPKRNIFIYTYFYRNQYIATDSHLKLLFRGKTIDTTSQAKLKVVKILKSGDTKLAAPPYSVNIKSTIHNNLLFIQSGLRGRFENSTIWNKASIIDVYNYEKQTYVGSCYIYHENDEKMTDFIANDSGIYAIIGHKVIRYNFGQPILSIVKN